MITLISVCTEITVYQVRGEDVRNTLNRMGVTVRLSRDEEQSVLDFIYMSHAAHMGTCAPGTRFTTGTEQNIPSPPFHLRGRDVDRDVVVGFEGGGPGGMGNVVGYTTGSRTSWASHIVLGHPELAEPAWPRYRGSNPGRQA